MGEVMFELNRFDVGERGRCRLRGRWFGIRGRRFMRPALTLIGEGRRTRLLADLAHKPWTAEDGKTWEAIFEGDLQGVELLEAELTVAPDITITLPVPALVADAAKRPPARRRRAEAPRGTRTDRRGVMGQRERPQQADESLSRGRLAGLTRELVEAKNELRQLRRQLTIERDAALAARDQATSERDELKVACERLHSELAQLRASSADGTRFHNL